MTGTLRWFKSSYSSDSGGECLEVAYAWRKSSYSDNGGGNCVEVAHEATRGNVGAVLVRDSKNPTGPTLTVSAGAWTAFLAARTTPYAQMT
ncbi:DUF397 domain-containing protein [Streptomyces colonosanans]|uniref:DUF397 domain-containing protein n=1 Tax=Streptomyces colonosanans TaxID=1428652 RepID=A0A1S2P1N7_9ACTN|nr:DUF397 domain-containing protein [Streptomyces colonosanans]OIJ87669.1 DUF397 domain-containing protein [Streptomyces colonosanans]